VPDTAPDLGPAPERRSALAACYVTGAHGAAAASDSAPGVTLKERRPLAVLHLSIRNADAGAVQAAGAAFGVDLPTEPGRSASIGGRTALPIGPGQWLLTAANVAHESESGDLADAVAAAVAAKGAVNDVSQGRCVLRIDGPESRTVLNKLCPLDLHPKAFAADACATTQMAHVAATLRRVGDGDAFDVFVARGFARHFWEALTHAAAEYGYQVLDPGL
jgi:heterotetrameric sarcosine oxidase gamma subunit